MIEKERKGREFIMIEIHTFNINHLLFQDIFMIIGILLREN